MNADQVLSMKILHLASKLKSALNVKIHTSVKELVRKSKCKVFH